MEKFKIGQMVISAFPGTGKSHYVNSESGYMPNDFATDSDSSKFDKSDFPKNYIQHIKNNINDGYARIFVSSHKDVREALIKNEIEFTLVYPSLDQKDDYIKRYKERGSSESFIKLISDNWENWINECKNQKGCKHIELKQGQFLSNVC